MAASESLYILQNDKTIGPYTCDELIENVRKGSYSPELLVTTGGSDLWQTLAQVAPEAVAVATQARLQGVQTKLNFAAVAALTGLLVAIGFVAIYLKSASASTTLSQQLREKEGELNAGKGVLDQSKQEIAKLKSEREEIQRGVEKAQAAAADAIKIQQSSIKRIKELEGGVRIYAGELYKQMLDNRVLTFLPHCVRLRVHVGSKGPLNFDSDAITAQATIELERNGYTVIQFDPNEEQSGYIVSIVVTQLEISKDINAAYFLDFETWGMARQGDAAVRMLLKHGDSGGYAGTQSGYQSKVREFVAAELPQSIQAMKKAHQRVLESRDPELAYAGLTRLGLGLSEELEPDSSGSGVLIDPHPYILTNHHVVEEARRIVAYFSGSTKSVDLVLVASEPESDLALLTTVEGMPLDLQASYPKFAPKLQLGAELFTLGFPLASVMGDEVKFNAGVVSSLKGLQDDVHRFQHTAPTQPGSSGGPVFLKNGEFCGLVSATLRSDKLLKAAAVTPQNVNFAIPPAEVEQFLRANKITLKALSEQRKALSIDEAKKLAVRLEVFTEP